MPLITTTTVHRVHIPVALDPELLFQQFNTYEIENNETVVMGDNTENIYRGLKIVVEKMLTKNRTSILNKLNSELARLRYNDNYGDSSLWGGR